MKNSRTESWRWPLIFGIAGIVMGVVLLHPAAMFIMDYQGPNRHLNWDAWKMAFSIQHLPMTEFFGGVGAAMGAVFGILGSRLVGSAKKIQVLEGILPICCVCKRIRNENAGEPRSPEWVGVEIYISSKTSADFSHTYCPKCYEQATADLEQDKRPKQIENGS